MPTAWITTSSTTVEAMVNPVNAACDQGYIPDQVYLLKNPGVTHQVDTALDLITVITTAYGGPEPEINVTTLESEVEFNQIRLHIKQAIEETRDTEGDVAVDITPGRKFMSAISFAAGLRYGADHVFYFYVASSAYLGDLYPNMPRTATHLYDFTEEL